MTQPTIRAVQTDALTTGGVPATQDDVLVTKRYIDEGAYVNYGPKAGQTFTDSTIPVYSSFPFALGVSAAASFTVIDNQSREVCYYHTNVPTNNKPRVFRCYRYSSDQPFIYDNDPISLVTLDPGTYVANVINVGTFFAVVYTTAQRILIVNTKGSSQWRDWHVVADVTSTRNQGISSWNLVPTSSGDRIMQVFTTSVGSFLNVYDNEVKLLRTQQLLDFTSDIDSTDYSGAGRVRTRPAGIGYSNASFMPSFSWNPLTGRLVTQITYHSPITNANGSIVSSGFALTIAWDIPTSWIASGAGVPVNKIPVKSGTYRYRIFPQGNDQDTNTSGISSGPATSGTVVSPVVDEYSGDLIMTTKSTFTTVVMGSRMRISSSYDVCTLGYNITDHYVEPLQYTTIIDSSPWGKGFGMARINGSTLIAAGLSATGTVKVSTTFDPTRYDSIVVQDDTIRLDASAAIVNPFNLPNVPNSVKSNASDRLFSTTAMPNGSALNYWIAPGQPVYVETASGSVLNYRQTAATLPTVIGRVIGSITVREHFSSVWNGNETNPIFWCLVSDTSTLYPYFIKCTNGTWSLDSGPQCVSSIAFGNNNRKDTNNTYISMGGALLTASGNILTGYSIPLVGDAWKGFNLFNTNTKTSETDWITRFSPTGVNGINQYQPYSISTSAGWSFGYSELYGYYAYNCSTTQSSAAFVCSRNVHTGSSISEADWLSGAVPRPQKFIQQAATVGLFAYLIEYPLFLGGYYGMIPKTTLSLAPNTKNYVYATRLFGRDPIVVSVSQTYIPNSFGRVIVAEITTNATDVISSVSRSYDGTGLPSYEGNQGKVLTTDGNYISWVHPSDVGHFTTVTMTPNQTINLNMTSGTPLTARVDVRVNDGAVWYDAAGVSTIQYSASGISLTNNDSVSRTFMYKVS